MSKSVGVPSGFRQNDLIEYRSEASGQSVYALIYSTDPSQGKFWIDRGIDGGKMMVSLSDLYRWGVKRISPVDLINREATLMCENAALKFKMDTARKALA